MRWMIMKRLRWATHPLALVAGAASTSVLVAVGVSATIAGSVDGECLGTTSSRIWCSFSSSVSAFGFSIWNSIASIFAAFSSGAIPGEGSCCPSVKTTFSATKSSVHDAVWWFFGRSFATETPLKRKSNSNKLVSWKCTCGISSGLWGHSRQSPKCTIINVIDFRFVRCD